MQETEKVILKPNPANDRIEIDFASVGSVIEIKILNMLGESVKEIQNIPANSTSVIIDVSYLQTGMYYLYFKDINNTRMTKKLIKN
jgi:hypothetical protein